MFIGYLYVFFGDVLFRSSIFNMLKKSLYIFLMDESFLKYAFYKYFLPVHSSFSHPIDVPFAVQK